MALDTSGRIWLGRNKTFYYDGTWHKYEGLNYVSAMETDKEDGIWIGSWNDYSQFHLQHMKSDLTLIDYTAANTDITPYEKNRLYLDKTGILWIYNTGGNGDRVLHSFDGENWINYSTFEGYPQSGVLDLARDNNNNPVIIDSKKNLSRVSGGSQQA